MIYSTSLQKKLALLNQVILDSVKFQSKKAIFSSFIKAGIKLLKADYGFIWFRTKKASAFTQLYKSSNTPYRPLPPRKKGFMEKVFQMRAVKFIGDSTKSKLIRDDAKKYMKSVAVIPIIYKRERYGNLVICFQRHRIFSAEDKILCAFIGNSASRSITIHNLYFRLKDFKDTLDKTLDSMFIFDPLTLKIEYANDGASDQLGLPREQLYRRTMVEIQESYKHEEFKALLAPLLMQEEKFLTAEGTIKNSRGRHIPIEMFLQYIRTPGRPGKILSIIQDITERKRVEQESQQLLKQKDEFLSIASHELKTPITTIKGFAQLLQANSSFSKNNVQKYFVEKINTQVGILTRLVNDLLDISRIETGKLKFRRRIFELSRLVESVTDNMQMNAAKHRIILKLKGQFWIFGDADRIGQVLINLIGNAIKYSPRARRVIVTLSQYERFAKVSVEDFGIGVDKKKQQKIFERFFQGKRDAETYPGLGLGLYISANIIKSHKGKIFCQSKKTKGTIFSFTVPYKRCRLKKRKN